MKYKSIYATLLVSLFMLSMMILPLRVYAAATIWTDKENYGPEETVTIFGSGFLPNAQVTINIEAPDLSVATIYAWTDGSGGFTAQYKLNGMEGTYTVAATDGTNTATTTFTEAAKVDATWSDGNCTDIKVTASGLDKKEDYYITYTDPDGNVQRTTPTFPGSSAYTEYFVLDITLPTILGTWTVKLYQVGVAKEKDTATVKIDKMVWTTDSTYTAMKTSFAQGETVYMKAIGLLTTKYYKFMLEPPVGSDIYVGAWTGSVTTLTGSYTLSGTAPTGSWKLHVRQATSSTGGGECHYVDCYFTVTTPPQADVAIQKTGVNYAHEGDTITYQFKVRNYGPGTAYNVQVIDNTLGDLTAKLPDTTLLNGEVNTFFVDYVVPTPSGDITNTVAVSSTTSDPNLANNQASWTVDVLHPGIDVTKSGPTYAHEGDTITYTVTVSNTGDCPLSSVSVTDSLLGLIYSNGLAVGQMKTFTRTYTVPSPSGDITNTVTASGTDALGRTVSDTASWTVDILHPGIDVSKTADKTMAHEGDTITYTITVKNTGDCPLSSVSVADSLLGTIYTNGLAVGETKTFTKTYNVPTPSDDIINTVTASGSDILGRGVSDSATWIVDVLHPYINVFKSGPLYAHEGDTITYTIKVSNPSTDTTMYKVSVIDSLFGDISASFSASLAPGASETKTFTYTVTSPSNDITNTVTVTYKNGLDQPLTDSATCVVDVLHPSISVSKSGPLYAHEGDTITYTITVSNTGDCPLSNVLVSDSLLGTIYSNDLAVGETKTFSVDYPIPIPSGDISNTVTAVGYDALGMKVSGSASWFVKVQYQITVTASPAGATGGTFKVTYTKSGITYTDEEHTTPWTEWVDSGTTVTLSAPQQYVPSEAGISGVRYKFDHYDPSASVTMAGPTTVTLVYKTQYYLTVLTFPEGLQPTPTPQSGWYDQCTYVTLTAPSTAHIGNIVYTFGCWQINGKLGWAGENPITIHMDSPKIACARYCELGDPIGDVNLDGKVDMIDIATIARHYGAKLGEPNYSVGCDLNLDGKIDIRDLAAAAINFSY